MHCCAIRYIRRGFRYRRFDCRFGSMRAATPSGEEERQSAGDEQQDRRPEYEGRIDEIVRPRRRIGGAG